MSNESLSAQAARTQFLEDLLALGFEEGRSESDGLMIVGEIEIELSSGRTIDDSVSILVGPDFPYRRPVVRLLFGATGHSWHRTRDGDLCLWPDDQSVADLPWKNAKTLVDRIERWLRNSAEDWPDDLPILDLERYFEALPGKFLVDSAQLDVQASRFFKLRSVRAGATDTFEMGEYISGPPLPQRVRGRRRKQLFGVALDLGELERPFATWSELEERLDSKLASTVTHGIRTKAVRVVVTRYSRLGKGGECVFLVKNDRGNVEIVGTLEPVSTSTAVRILRAGPGASALADRSVAIIGVGAIGSHVADQLIRRGIGRVSLFDPQEMRPGNAIRHLVAEEQHELSPKVEAVQAHIGHYGFVQEDQIETTVTAVRKIADAQRILESHDIVVDSTASGECSALLADLAAVDTAAVVAVALQRNGDIIRVDRYPADDHYPTLEGLEETGREALIEAGCADPISPATPDAVAEAAIWTTRVVIDSLTEQGALGPTLIAVVSPQPDAPLDEIGVVIS